MQQQSTQRALTILQWVLGLVVLVEALMLAFVPGARHQFAKSGMPDMLRLVLAWGEIIGAILFLIPQTVVRGAWILMCVFILAAVVHVLHGMPNVGFLLIYTAGAWAVAASR
jgi:DoxX-like family